MLCKRNYRINNHMKRVKEKTMDTMDNNNAETTNTNAAPQQQGQQTDPKGSAGLPVSAKIVAIVAAVIVLLLIILIPNAVKASENAKVKKAIETYVEVFITGDTDPDDVKWRKYYPKDVEDDFLDWAEDRYDYLDDYDGFDNRYEYKVLSITKLKGEENIEMFEDQIKYFFDSKDCRIRSKDLKISKCYVVIIRDDSSRTPELSFVLVAKVNGKYGVYAFD